MRTGVLARIGALALVGAGSAGAETPLDVFDPTPRAILVRFEISPDPGVVAESFGAAWPASWSVSGGVGRIEIAAQTHAEARVEHEGLGFAPVPDSFAPIAIEIDLATLEATSEPTHGALAAPPLGASFATRALGTTATAGFIGPGTSPLFCTSQQQVDALCALVPSFCGKICTIVPGSAYAPGSGHVNLVGSEQQQGCDGSICFGPFEVFATTGDLFLGESVAVPALSTPGRVALALLLAAAVAAGRWRSGAAR